MNHMPVHCLWVEMLHNGCWYQTHHCSATFDLDQLVLHASVHAASAACSLDPIAPVLSAEITQYFEPTTHVHIFTITQSQFEENI